MRKPIEAIAVCDNPLIRKYCEESEVRELEKKLEVAVEALKYYGSEESWGCDDYGRTDVSYDCGSEAREALAAIEETK